MFSSVWIPLAWFLDAPARILGERHRWVLRVSRSESRSSCARARCTASPRGASRCEMRRGGRTTRTLSLATTVGTLGVYLAVHNGLALDRFGARPCRRRSHPSRCCSMVGTCSRARGERERSPGRRRSRARSWAGIGHVFSSVARDNVRQLRGGATQGQGARRVAGGVRGAAARSLGRRRTEARSWGTCPGFSRSRALGHRGPIRTRLSSSASVAVKDGAMEKRASNDATGVGRASPQRRRIWRVPR